MQPHPFSTRVSASVPLLVSDIVPEAFVHGFSTRAGGASLPPFESLNLGWKWGDEPAKVEENHRRLLAATGAASMARVSQIHGTTVLRVRREDSPGDIASETADGLCTNEPGLGLSVHVADCTPIILACPRTLACATLHAGWRGTLAGMASAGVRALVREFGCDPRDVRVAIGPCIGRCCFEVGPEVREAFAAVLPATRIDEVIALRPGAKPHIDLRRYQVLDLEREGILPENIDVSSDCTFCDPAGRFFSFRKHGRVTGQLVGFVVRRSPKGEERLAEDCTG